MRVEQLRRDFRGRSVLRDLDLRVDVGERLAVSGPNGSGKTTLLRCMAGSLIPTSGQILVDGHTAGSRAARSAAGVSLSQERSFYLRLSGRTNLRFFARLRCRDRRSAYREVAALEEELALQEIAAERCDRCSTGMLQQLAFARALLGEPRLLLLDEPTRSLDESAFERVWAALDRRPHLAVVIATHRDDEIQRSQLHLELTVQT